AENPAPADKQVTAGSKDAADSSTKDAATSGTGQTQDGQGQVKGEDQSEDAVVGAATSDAKTTAAAVENDGNSAEGGVTVDEGCDDSMVAAAVDGPADDDADEQVASRSIGQRLDDFDSFGRRDENLDRAGATIGAAAAAVGSGTVRAGRESRLAIGRVREVPA